MNLPLDLNLVGFVIAAFAVFVIGLAKSSVPAAATMPVGLFDLVIPAKLSVGAILPLLILGDIMALLAYRKAGRWDIVARILPSVFVGMVIGYFLLSWSTSREVAYTPPWSGTLGNGTIAGNYQRIGNKVSVWIKLVWGSTTSHPAAVQTFGLPYTSSATSGGGGTWYANDFGTGSKTGTVRIVSGQTACTLYDDATATQVSDTVPMTWANQDSIELFFTYFV